VTKACQLFLVPSRSSNPPLYPSKGCELGSVLRLLLFRCFLLGLTFEPFKELGVRHLLLGQTTGNLWTHLTHHGPNSGEATTFPHIVFSASHCRTCIIMALFPGTPKVESQNCPGLDSQDFGHSYLLAPTSGQDEV
jgi:hypothetical protein